MLSLAPLYDLRILTPRLTLRLPTHDELCGLRELAARGIHPPEEMPFAMAWTDEPYSDSWLVDHHESVLARWRPDAWRLNLGVWFDGQIIGSQGIGATDFAATKRFNTGSWLGQNFQRQGYGTEMRAAVLEFGFRGLGGEYARSGYLKGNLASAGVSRRLGYSVTGRRFLSPRGIPIEETELELHRRDWRSPITVVVENLDPALWLFGG